MCQIFMIKRGLLLCSVFFISSYSLLSAQESSQFYFSSLQTLKKKIARTESEMKSLKKNVDQAKNKLSSVESDLKRLKVDESNSVESLKSLASHIDSLELQKQDIAAQLALKQDSFSSRLTNMYKSRRKLSSISFLLVSSELNSFYRRADYLKRLVENDNEQLQEYRLLLETLALTSQDLENLKKEEEDTQKRLTGIRKDLLPRQLEAARLVKELSDSVRKKQEVLTSYKDEERELEEIVQKITGGDKSKEEKAPSRVPSAGFKVASLPKPVDGGTVIQHFGKQKHEEFSDVIFVKGIEVAVSEGAAVRVVAAGTVVFSSELPGFGNVIIVEHPGEYYTLYGRILPEKVVDDVLQGGDLIGRTSSPDAKGRNFYFEIRKEGKPLNPEKYLAKYQ